MTPEEWLPIVFVAILGVAVLFYAVLDGYDLGVGILLPLSADAEPERDVMISSIGPFWDANETWLVLIVGVLFIAFPTAHSMILQALYIPTLLLLLGLILRGVAFDFRAKSIVTRKHRWDRAFKAGSLLATLSLGYMLGLYVMGFETNVTAHSFAIVSAGGVTAAFTYMGAAWLVWKTEGELQKQAAHWGRVAGWLTGAGILLVSVVNVSIDPSIFDRWFGFPETLLLLPLPILTAALIVLTDRYFAGVPHSGDRGAWKPLASVAGIFVLGLGGLAYSYFPYVVPNQLTIWEASASKEPLIFILVGVVIVLPFILGYTAFSYRVFRGKATELRYY
ncbi:cytochrome d ubiquinol oxidase subunit II [Gilvimarinus sp. F26214L]|uniref:cytochrome d ubiquinol oxidase subunit II n=1 Tax=Gilvimarinus sp. DZF01 TaxID=3461371 RepID=UPI0040458F64